MSPEVSVIVATRNRQALLAETLHALVRQDFPHEGFELVVADNGSTDATRSVVERTADLAERPGLRYLYVAPPGKSNAVNEALAIAHGRIIAFTDDDVRPERNWIGALVDAISRPGVEFVAGRVLPIWETAPPSWISPALYGVLAVPDNGSRPIVIASTSSRVMPIGANMAVRRSVIERIGGLRPDLGKLDGSLRTGEDHEFFLRMLRAGCRGLYEPGATVYHWVPAERLSRHYFRSWHYQNGRDVARLQTSYPESGRRLLRVPGYLWRQTANDARGIVASSGAKRFAAWVRLGWMAGYLHESWFGQAAGPDLSRAS
jgi:glycosyltransferase involved in cell wall biosynthesis